MNIAISHIFREGYGAVHKLACIGLQVPQHCWWHFSFDFICSIIYRAWLVNLITNSDAVLFFYLGFFL